VLSGLDGLDVAAAMVEGAGWSEGLRCAIKQFVTVLMLALAFPGPAQAQKTDVVVLFNGDVLTGDVKELYRGLLRFKTDSMSTVYIEWLDIKSIRSDKNFTLETVTGLRAFGNIKTSGDFASIEVAYADRSVRLDKYSVVVITQIKDTFINRLDGSVSAGLNFRKANSEQQYNFGFTVKYRSQRHTYDSTFSATSSTREDSSPNERYFLNVGHRFYLRPKWATLEGAELEQNSELDLRLRTLLLGGGQRQFVNTNQNRFDASAGLALNNESYFSAAKSSRTSLECFGSVGYEYFKFNTPKADLVARFTVFPSLTERGRVRTSLNSVLSWEIIADLTLNFTVYASTDNRPPNIEDDGEETAVSDSDYGLTTSLGWTF
jgi:hypothetical protein